MQTYSAQERSKYLSAWKASGKSGKQFCRENNLRATTFYGWIRTGKKKVNQDDFVLIQQKIESSPNNNSIILEIGNIKMHIPSGFNPGDVKTLLSLLSVCHVN